MDPLGDVRQLQRITEEDQIARRGTHCKGIGERDLPRLVDDETVEGAIHALRRVQPGGAGDEAHLLRWGERVNIRLVLDE